MSNNNIGDSVLENFDFLKELSRTRSDKARKQLIKEASSEELLAVVEICLNILKSRSFCLNPKDRKKLLPFANYIRRLSRVRSTQSARRVIQEGSGIALAALITPILIEAAKSIISKIKEE